MSTVALAIPAFPLYGSPTVRAGLVDFSNMLVAGTGFALTAGPADANGYADYFGTATATAPADTTALPYWIQARSCTAQTDVAFNAAGGTNLVWSGEYDFIVSGNATQFSPGDQATGLSLGATGLDQISASVPTNTASTFPKMLVQLWARFFAKSTLTASGTTGTLVTFSGTNAATTQALSDSGTVQTVGPA